MSTRPVENLAAHRALVYVVDTDPRVRASVASLLATLGAEVRTYASAADALGDIGDVPPNVLIADSHLPDLGGVELLGVLRQRGLRIPTVLLSKEDDVAFAVAAMRAGAVDFIEKPYVDRALLNQVAPLLGLDDRAG